MARSTLLVCLGLCAILGATSGVAAEDIPPNCTLDPFTHKMNCPIPPNCTLDPFTHTMNCHQSATQGAVSQSNSQSKGKTGLSIANPGRFESNP